MRSAPVYSNEYFLVRFKDGDERAFEKVFKSDYNRIVGFCQQFVYDKDAAQSVAQEAFVKLWINREKIESINGIRSFLYTSSKSDCLNYIRHTKVTNKYQAIQLEIKERELNRDILESFDFEILELTELENLINQSINELPEQCRNVFKMSRIECKKNSEIATQLNISVKSVEANITRALKTLRVKLAEYLPFVLVQFILHSI